MAKENITPTPKTVTVTIPEGMTPEEFLKAMKSFEDIKVKAQKIAKADGQAMRRLREAHKPELKKYRVEEWHKVGLDPSNLK